MPEAHPYPTVSYEGLEVVPYSEAPETYMQNTEQPGLEPIENAENRDLSEKQAVNANFPLPLPLPLEKAPLGKEPAWRDPPSGLKKRQSGRSRRFWIIAAVGAVLVVAAVIGAAVGATVGRHHKSTTTTTTVKNIALDCPAIDRKGYNSTVLNGTDTTQTVSSEYKQFCTLAPVSESIYISELSPNPEGSSSNTSFTNPANVTSFDACIDLCTTINVAEPSSRADFAGCYAVWFDANRTAFPGGNCYTYTTDGGNVTLANMTVAGDPLTVMAFMIVQDGVNFTQYQYLSDNGDWNI